MFTSNLPKVSPKAAAAPLRESGLRNDASPSPGRELLGQHLQLICQKLEHLSRRSGLPEHEAEELRSWAMFKLVENDYRILGRWRGRSSFPTFLTVVLVSLMRDYRIQRCLPTIMENESKGLGLRWGS